ncbi:MAG: amidohydrolase family protein [Saprospiraceae bacterium]|nr:amidohydrolase family protein [Saprospiraceae bacterium]
MRIQHIFIVLFACLTTATAQQVEKSTSGTFALTNATIETVTNGTVQGTVVIQNGRIAAVGANARIPSGAQTIDCNGMTVYPGMIDGGTTLGLTEVGSISLTQDYDEIGDVTPHVSALTAVNPNSVLIPVTRVSGVTTVLTKPTGGLFPGTASVIDLHGYTPEQMATGYECIIMNFPSSGRRGRWDRRSDEDIKKAEEKALKKLNDVWEQARLYERIAREGGKAALDYNPRMEALIPAVRGEMAVHIEVNRDKDILSALKWIADNEVNAVLTGVSEGWRVADSIAAAGVPVITGPVLRTPGRASDRYDIAYRNAGLMQQAGVQVAIRSNDSENVRNLPYNAGFAAAYGMGRMEALKAVTIVPAQIMGLGATHGSIEVGKVANLFVADGDIFETKTHVHHLFINGWKVPLESRHTLLYDEFLERRPGLKK